AFCRLPACGSRSTDRKIRRSVLPVIRRHPVARLGSGFHLTVTAYFYPDGVPAAFILVVRAVGQHVLAVEFLAHPLDRVLESLATIKAELRPTRTFCEDLGRRILEDRLRVAEDLDEQRQELRR